MSQFMDAPPFLCQQPLKEPVSMREEKVQESGGEATCFSQPSSGRPDAGFHTQILAKMSNTILL